ncbi:MAG: hypothetical protein O4861_22170 [Trichodesmium sp. St16_bin4-tuft]|nr:hypothetical protein [Trichodesmium sp. St5_bin8]MDE5078970.1 hypothetical protein [Trichodesmium sp. St2_bin6]MDE5100891.1 hypothetical protein [Trichodesmium sp. St16_bin4-tuft]MDE5105232.1 hypothetical protein [Trichodesmium sp. St19_bin2]
MLKRLTVKIGKNIYKVKDKLLSDYLLQELKKSHNKNQGYFYFIGVFNPCFNKGKNLKGIVKLLGDREGPGRSIALGKNTRLYSVFA